MKNEPSTRSQRNIVIPHGPSPTAEAHSSGHSTNPSPLIYSPADFVHRVSKHSLLPIPRLSTVLPLPRTLLSAAPTGSRSPEAPQVLSYPRLNAAFTLERLATTHMQGLPRSTRRRNPTWIQSGECNVGEAWNVLFCLLCGAWSAHAYLITCIRAQHYWHEERQ